jgi:diacylglycerol kinase
LYQAEPPWGEPLHHQLCQRSSSSGQHGTLDAHSDGRGDAVKESDSRSISGRIKSFRNAFRGLALVLRSEENAWIHALATVVVCVTALYLDISRSGWCWLVLAMVAVWSSEAFNTALERLADAVHPETHPLVGEAKDAAAGAVLICALGSVVIGLLVLGPPLIDVLLGSS